MSTKSTPPVPLDSAGLVWFNEIKNKALAVMPAAPAAGSPPAKAVVEINRVLAVPADQLTQQEVFDLEDWMMGLLPLEDLKQWVNSLREDYREAFGSEAYQRIQPTLLAQVSAVTAATITDLQSEARRLQQELHWQAAIQPQAQRKKEGMILGLFFVVLGILSVCVLTWGWSVLGLGEGQVQFGALVVMMGALGGFISSVQRVSSAEIGTSRAITATRHDRFALSVIMSPMQGAIFAVLLALVLVGRLTPPGSVVPDVSLGTTNCPCATNPPAAIVGSNLTSRVVSVMPDTNSPGAGTNPIAGVPTNSQSISTNLPAGSSNPPAASSPPPVAPTTNAVVGGPTRASGSSATGEKCRYPFFMMWLCFGSGKDVALLLLWAFLAGFSERLVPDTLSKIADKAKG